MLSLFTIKKILFFGTLGSGIVAPIVATSPIIREFSLSSDISPLKEGIVDFGKVDIYEGESVPSFLKKSLMYKDGQDGLIESFSQEISKKWYFSQPFNWTSKQQEEWKKLKEKQFKDAWEKLKPNNPQRDFWDNYWGSRENMDSFWLRHNSHKLVKSYLTNVKKTDFYLNTSYKGSSHSYTEELSSLFAKNSLLKEKDLENKENWTKIGFFPSNSLNQDKSLEKLIWGKYEFINWSYKKWFRTFLPVYFWKISWNYQKNASNSDLSKEYNFKTLGEKAPGKASYAFPIFSTKTTSKFQSFIKKISENGNKNDDAQNLNLEKYFVEGWYGDQDFPATLVEILDSFEALTPEYASATSYLVNKVLNVVEKESKKEGKNNSKIHELKKEELKKNNDSQKPISIFFDDNVQSSEQKNNNQGLISLDSKILKNDSSKRHIHDVRETENWVFFRDEKGVHALTLDGYEYLNNSGKENSTTNIKVEDHLFNWFNFRNLQSLNSRKYWSSNKKFLNSKDDWFTKFSNFLTQNFDRLFTEYYVKEGDKALLFNLLKEKAYFNNFKEVFNKLFDLREFEELNRKIFQLRKKIIEKYSSRNWTSKSSGNKSIQSDLEQGLSSPYPYEINLNEGENGFRFPDQEKVFWEFLRPKQDPVKPELMKAARPSGVEPTQTKENDYTKALHIYAISVKELIDSNNAINLTTRSHGFDFQNSQRLFVIDSIFDYLLDKLFSNKDLLNYLVKEEKLLKSGLFGSNSLLKDKTGQQGESNLPWVAPFTVKIPQSTPKVELAQASTPPKPEESPVGCWKCESFKSGEETTNKDNLRSLLNHLLKIYFFRSYLKTLGEDYFNFLIDFPKGANTNKENQATQSSESTAGSNTKFDFLVSELFEKWRSQYLFNLKEKNHFLDFLITLNYLSKNQFSNLREDLTSELAQNTKYHYLFFENVSENNPAQKEPAKEKVIHPFLSGQKEKTHNEFFANKSEATKFIREKWKTKGNLRIEEKPATLPESQQQSQTKEAILKNLISGQNNLPNKSDNLFNFKNLKKLLTTIKNISSTSDFDNIVHFLSKVHKTINTNFYKVNKIYMNNNQEKKIYLEEKKKLLIYQLLNKDKGPFYSSKNFSTQEDKDIIGKKLDELIAEADKAEVIRPTTTNTSTQVASSQNSKHIDKKLFQRFKGKVEGGYLIQVSAEDFRDDASICAFFNLLPIELLSDFLILQTDKPLNQEKAQTNFFDATYRLKPRDIKFKSHINNKHLG